VTVKDLKKRMDELFQKGCELLKSMDELRQEKAYLKVRFLSRLEELQKAWEEVSDLQEKVALARLIGGTSRSWHSSTIDEACRQSEHYDRLWITHGALLKEVQMLRSQVIILSSCGQVDSTGGWLGSMSCDPEGT